VTQGTSFSFDDFVAAVDVAELSGAIPFTFPTYKW